MISIFNCLDWIYKNECSKFNLLNHLDELPLFVNNYLKHKKKVDKTLLERIKKYINRNKNLFIPNFHLNLSDEDKKLKRKIKEEIYQLLNPIKINESIYIPYTIDFLSRDECFIYHNKQIYRSSNQSHAQIINNLLLQEGKDLLNDDLKRNLDDFQNIQIGFGHIIKDIWIIEETNPTIQEEICKFANIAFIMHRIPVIHKLTKIKG
mgnify:CR=1 FL=1